MEYKNWNIEDLKFEINSLVKEEVLSCTTINILETAVYMLEKKDREATENADKIVENIDKIVLEIEDTPEEKRIESYIDKIISVCDENSSILIF